MFLIGRYGMKRVLLVLLCALLLSGCSWSRYYTAETLIDPALQTDIRAFSYYVAPEDKNVSRSSLEFKRFLSICEQALNWSGFRTVPSASAADCIIYAKYGSTSKTETVYEDRPIYDTVRVAKTTHGHAKERRHGTSYTEHTFYDTRQVLVGYEQVSREVTLHHDYVVLQAYKGKEEIWQLTCRMQTSGGTIFSQPDSAPQWLEILRYNLGTNTGAVVGRTLLYDDDARVYHH